MLHLAVFVVLGYVNPGYTFNNYTFPLIFFTVNDLFFVYLLYLVVQKWALKDKM